MHIHAPSLLGKHDKPKRKASESPKPAQNKLHRKKKERKDSADLHSAEPTELLPSSPEEFLQPSSPTTPVGQQEEETKNPNPTSRNPSTSTTINTPEPPHPSPSTSTTRPRAQTDPTPTPSPRRSSRLKESIHRASETWYKCRPYLERINGTIMPLEPQGTKAYYQRDGMHV